MRDEICSLVDDSGVEALDVAAQAFDSLEALVSRPERWLPLDAQGLFTLVMNDAWQPDEAMVAVADWSDAAISDLVKLAGRQRAAPRDSDEVDTVFPRPELPFIRRPGDPIPPKEFYDVLSTFASLLDAAELALARGRPPPPGSEST